MLKGEIHIRDPFVVPCPTEKIYYLFGSTDENCWGGPATGFDFYRSTDLEHWEGPFPAFRPPAGFWSNTQYWAPEVHRYQDRYYMFASFKAENVCRGTQILVADTIEGPYRPHSDGPVTPRKWECLDGTLFVDETRTPWMVFCHEWVQVHNGEICAMPLTDDLKQAAGEPVLLFKAKDAPWACRIRDDENYVTDGPFLYPAAGGALLMLWSSVGRTGYALGVATSATGNILGPWTQNDEALFSQDGGHGMLFKTFDGELRLSIHKPNQSPIERPVFIPAVQTGNELKI